MAFKKYPQPPFKKYVKTECGKVLDSTNRHIEPAVFNKKTGKPMVQYGWEITWEVPFQNGTGFLTFIDVIIATSDTKEELL